ncbi:hypothetical protein EW146_g7434 [Bondarzewia mesenterica]|uniref:F-box domain-containing protein n=1 Tax=Bondarzewia mesenterica TaxID=1095465 RepID=A0A4S4LML9_9AGAM|nr:hypothetical protein EW146_g7434 [Bondarzewia mesenterica]
MQSCVTSYPPELLSTICAHVFAAGQPTCTPSLDPLFVQEAGVPTSLPSSYPPANWPEPVARRTLANLALVNRAWFEAAKPWLWRKLEVRLPCSWLSLVEEITGGEDEDADVEQAALVVDQSISEAAKAALAMRAVHGEEPDQDAAMKLKESILESLSGPGSSIPPELLSPPASRDPSPRRLRAKSKSPARWKLMRSISDAVQDLMGRDEHGMYGALFRRPLTMPVSHISVGPRNGTVPAMHDPRPGRYVRHLDFNHFRTIGMRRSVEEGVSSRFVTGSRLEAVLKETPNLTAFGATEYMDGALTLSVLKELFMRGAPSRGRGQPLRGRGFAVEDPDNSEMEDTARRRECKELEAVDLTGCVSAVFVNALTDFVNIFLLTSGDADSSSSEDEEVVGRGRTSRSSRSSRLRDEPLSFPGLQRLSLRGAKSIPPTILNPFVLAFPHLTHLDLSCTRVPPEFLDMLGTSTTIHLRSLSLGRCIRLTGESIRDFLVSAPAAHDITELNLYGDGTFPCPLSPSELRDILTSAPCFTSGGLVYLDLSSAPLNREHLEVMVPHTKLRSLGLSYIPNLELNAIADFMRLKAINVEVLTLLGTSPELGHGQLMMPAGGAGVATWQRVTPRQASIALHKQLLNPLCTPPFSFSISGITPRRDAPTRLRIIELATPLLAGLGAGAGSWRIIKSKGGRGWYVDAGCGWISEVGAGGARLVRGLEREHPWREGLEKLADANGNVSSGVGWHARKMEVLHGHGLLGREDGLYGAVSFAYQG